VGQIERIRVELSPFEKLQILRAEEEDRKKELAELEAEIREKNQFVATQRYLESLSPYYAANPRAGLPTREEIDALETRRVQLHELIANIAASMEVAIQSTGKKGGAAPAQPEPSAEPAGSARKAKFDF
jgi:hypothetical protein